MLKKIHNRMPVIYDQPMGKSWLDGVASTMMLNAVLQPWPAGYMVAQEVSKLVNAPANDRPECIVPVPGGQVLDGHDYEASSLSGSNPRRFPQPGDIALQAHRAHLHFSSQAF